MVSVYSISDFGLFDFCVGGIDFLARLTARSKWTGQGRSALCNPRIMKQPICRVITIIHYLSVEIPLTTRVVDPLSLATVADSIMVEVE